MNLNKSLLIFIFTFCFLLTSCEILELNVPETAGPNENVEVSVVVSYDVGSEEMYLSNVKQEVFIAFVPESWEIVSVSHQGTVNSNPVNLSITYSSTPPSDFPPSPSDETCNAVDFFNTYQASTLDNLDGLQVIYFVSEMLQDNLVNSDTAELTVVFSQGQNPPDGEQPVAFTCAQNIDDGNSNGCFTDFGSSISSQVDFINIINTTPAPLLDSKGVIGLIAAFLLIGFFSLRKKKVSKN